MKRTLHLANPLLHGPDVRAAQMELVEHGYLGKQYIDGKFGSHSADASEVAKFRKGYPSDLIKPTYGPTLHSYLTGKTKLPVDYQKRAKQREGVSYLEFEILATRHKIAAIAQWGIHNEPSIHYAQSRPIDGINHPYQLPLDTDCSGFVTLCYKWAGAPDPNGRSFDGQGYTGTLLQHMKPIMKSQAKIGDVVVWGAFPGHHTALIIGGPHDDPLLCSHGQEAGPVPIHYVVESKFQPKTVTWLTLPKW